MIDTITALLHQYPVQAIALWSALQYLFNAIVDSLPQPVPMGSQLYQFIFTLAHKLAGNLTRQTQPNAALTQSEKS